MEAKRSAGMMVIAQLSNRSPDWGMACCPLFGLIKPAPSTHVRKYGEVKRHHGEHRKKGISNHETAPKRNGDIQTVEQVQLPRM